MEDNWNGNEWQGRTKKQVEGNNKTFDLSIKVILFILGIIGVLTLFSCKTNKNVDCDAYSKLNNNIENGK